MALVSIGDSIDALSPRRRNKWTENSKVYRRRFCKNAPKVIATNSSAPVINLVSKTTRCTTPTDLFSVVALHPNSSTTSNLRAINANAISSITVFENRCYGAVRDAVGAVVKTGDVDSLQPSMQVGSACQTVEPQNVRGSPSPYNIGGQSLKNPSRDLVNELMQRNGHDLVKLREASPLNSESNLLNCTSSPNSDCNMLNGRAVETAQLLVSEDLHHHGVLPRMPPYPPIGSGSSDAISVVNPHMISNVDDSVRFHLSKSTSKNEIEELRKNLERQLDQIRKVVKQLEAKEI